MRYQTKKNMRTFTLMAFGFGVVVSGLGSQPIYAQSGSQVRLRSAAYQPSSPVTENRLFRLQTGHYGFAYNCDGEEAKRNNLAIGWCRSHASQLPKRMSCLERIRHEAAQVSRRLLDGMCDSGCDALQAKNEEACGCAECVGQQSFEPVMEQTSETVEPMGAEIIPLAGQLFATSRRSGLIQLTQFESVAEVTGSSEKDFDQTRQVLVEASEAVAANERVHAVAANMHQMSLLERLEVAQASEAKEQLEQQGKQQGLLARLKAVRAAQELHLLKPEKF